MPEDGCMKFVAKKNFRAFQDEEGEVKGSEMDTTLVMNGETTQLPVHAFTVQEH